MTDRKQFTMTLADHDALLKRINDARSAPLIMLQTGGPPSVQSIANAAWCALGDQMGFDGMTVEPIPGGSSLSFMAIPKEIVVAEPVADPASFPIVFDPNAPREAAFITGLPSGPSGEDGIEYVVGQNYHRQVDGKGKWEVGGTVTRITVTWDLPGLHGNLERVRVYDGQTMIFEAPLHNLEGVGYPAPAAS